MNLTERTLLAVQSYTTAKSKGIMVANPRWYPIPPCLTHRYNNINFFGIDNGFHKVHTHIDDFKILIFEESYGKSFLIFYFSDFLTQLLYLSGDIIRDKLVYSLKCYLLDGHLLLLFMERL